MKKCFLLVAVLLLLFLWLSPAPAQAATTVVDARGNVFTFNAFGQPVFLGFQNAAFLGAPVIVQRPAVVVRQPAVKVKVRGGRARVIR